MTKKAETLLREALALSETQRAEIAGVLLASLEPTPELDVEKAWREEVQGRLQRIDAGKAELVPWEEVRERLFSRQRPSS